jgi:PIN domain nuclease of toxin-antitoxin system
MAIQVVADTHAFIWYLYNDPRLSETAGSLFDAIVKSGHQVGVSAITLVEMVYLSEKGKIPVDSLERSIAVLKNTGSPFVEIPIGFGMIDALQRIERSIVPDMPDRIIAASALYLGVPVASRDNKIRLSVVETIW